MTSTDKTNLNNLKQEYKNTLEEYKLQSQLLVNYYSIRVTKILNTQNCNKDIANVSRIV